MTSVKSVVRFFLAISLSTASANAEQPIVGSTANESEEVLDWFSSLGLPDTNAKPFARIEVSEAAAPKRVVSTHGFLVLERPQTYTFLTTGLRFIDVPRTSRRDDASVPTIQWLRFSGYTTQLAADPPERLFASTPGFCWEFGAEFRSICRPLDVHECTAYCVLAWFCKQHGLLAQSSKLALIGSGRKPELTKSNRLIDELREDLSEVFTDRAIALLANPRQSRIECAAALKWVAVKFPGNNRRAMQILTVISPMLREDQRYAGRNFLSETRPLSANRLVYYLRDQTSWDMDDEVFFGYVSTHRGFTSPAERLLDMRDDAVPALIDALSDHRLTRVVANRNHDITEHGRIRVLTIGEVAFDLLAELLGDAVPTGAQLEDLDTEGLQELQTRIRDIWRESRKDGESSAAPQQSN